MRPLLLLSALALASCAASGGPSFFSTSPLRYDLGRAEVEAPSEAAQEAAEARVTAALKASSPLTRGTTRARVELRGRIMGEGTLEIARDTLGRVRRVSHEATTPEAPGAPATRTYAEHWFDAEGFTVAVTHVHQTGLPAACERPVERRFVDLWLDRGRLVSVDHRLSDPVTECTPARPSGQTVLVFPDAASLLAAAGVADLEALDWGRGIPSPAPAPRRN